MLDVNLLSLLFAQLKQQCHWLWLLLQELQCNNGLQQSPKYHP
uniref:Uncharacterized protein n=1 Tax=Rhizophora mucronata TaxID=61149 RepID=A0A2P2IM35_RHIMU